MVFGLKKEGVKPLPQLPVLAVSPPSRPHTPYVTTTGDIQSATHRHDDKTTTTTDRIDPVPQTPTASPRHRSFSIGLLSPEIPPGSSKPSHWSISSGDTSSFISDYSFSEAQSLCESPTTNNVAAGSQFPTSDAEGPGNSAGEDSQLTGPKRTVYHIYHSGYRDESFSIHLAPDSLSKPPSVKGIFRKWTESEIDPRVPIYFLHKPRLYGHCPGLTLRWGGDGRDFIRDRTVGSKKKFKRDMKYAPAICHISGDLLWRKWEIEFAVLVPRNDDPKLKRPEGQERLFWRHRHSWTNWQCLAHAKGTEGTKLFQGKHTKDKSSWVYKGLNELGVMDGRGLISSWYPFRKGPYRWRGGGETGKEWVEKEVAKRKVRRKSTSDLGGLRDAKNQDAGDMSREDGNTVKEAREEEQTILLPPEMLPKHLLPIQLDPAPGVATEGENLTGSALMPTFLDAPQTTAIAKGPPHPAKLDLRWPNILLRDYPFTYLSVPFYWRGTSDLHEYQPSGEGDAITKCVIEEAKKKKEGIDWCMLAHLKLVVSLPRSVVSEWGEVGARLLGQKACNTSGTCVDSLGKEISKNLEGVTRIKRRNRSLSICSSWSGSARRNTPPKEKQEQEQQWQPHQNIPLESGGEDTENGLLENSLQNEDEGNSVRNNDSRDGKSQHTTYQSSNQASPSPQPPPTRSSTWGTFSSTSTLVWPRSRSNTTFSQVSMESTNTLMPVGNPKAKIPKTEKSSCKASGAAHGGGEHETKVDFVEIVLARYQCVISHRKAGKLVVDEDILEQLARYVYRDGRKVKVLNNPERASNANVVKREEMEKGKGREGGEERGKSFGDEATAAKVEQILGSDEILVEGTKTINSTTSYLTSPTLLSFPSPNLEAEVGLRACDGLSSAATAAKTKQILGMDEIPVEGTTKTVHPTTSFLTPPILFPFSSPFSSQEPSEPGLAQLPSTPAEPSASQQGTHTHTNENGEQAEDQKYQRYEDQPQGSLEDLTTQRERLRHVIVATVMCLIIAEKEKRDVVREILLAIATEGSSMAGV